MSRQAAPVAAMTAMSARSWTTATPRRSSEAASQPDGGVLRPGGRKLTERLLGLAGVPNVDVVELAPGLGCTAASILDLGPASYTGVDSDPDAVAAVRRVVGSAAQLVEADAAETGLGGEYADLVIGEAMLTRRPRTPSSLRLPEFCVLAVGMPFMNWGLFRKMYPKISKLKSAKD